jgi:transposase, IS30 family
LRWSPEQIAAHLATDPVLVASRVERVSHETTYRALYVQGRGQLRAELHQCLRSGRARRLRNRVDGGADKSRIADMINISERPAEVADRAVPGHWEGDLLIGKNNGSAIATLVERQTRYCLLVALPDGYRADLVAAALIKTIQTLPAHLRRSLTWDQGMEMTQHPRIKFATDLDIYFCDPHSPWQRGSNENTNGLLRQYFPKGTELQRHSQEHLAAVAAELNGRPRKTLGWATPAEAMTRLLSHPEQPIVATTT